MAKNSTQSSENIMRRNSIITERPLTEEEINEQDEMKVSDAEKKLKMKLIVDKLNNESELTKEDLKLILDLKKTINHNIDNETLRKMAVKVKDPELCFEVAKEINYSEKDLEEIAYKNPEVAVKYATTIEGTNVKKASKIAISEFKKDPIDAKLDDLIKLSNTDDANVHKIENIVLKYGDAEQLSDLANKSSEVDINRIDEKVSKNLKKLLKKESNHHKAFEYAGAYFVHNEKTTIEGIADSIFGKDADIILMKNEKKKNNLLKKKQSFIDNANDSKRDYLIAEAEAKENAVFEERNKEAIEFKANKEYLEYLNGQMSAAQFILDDARRRHPKQEDYDKYMEGIRNSKAYKKAYKKYSEIYEKKKAECYQRAIIKVKEDAKKLAKEDTSKKETKKTQVEEEIM